MTDVANATLVDDVSEPDADDVDTTDSGLLIPRRRFLKMTAAATGAAAQV